MDHDGSRDARTTDGIDRRAFLTGRMRRTSAPPRPPGARWERAFLQRCTRCAACIAACGADLIRRGRGGYPEMVFERGECEFCGRCIAACLSGALAPPAVSALRAVVSDACVARNGIVCRSCADACPEMALVFRLRAGHRGSPQLDASACSGCGACIRACPAAAIGMSVRQAPLVPELA